MMNEKINNEPNPVCLIGKLESDDLLLGEIGKEEFIRRLQEVDFPNGVLRRNNIDTVKGKWEEKRRLIIERNSNGKRLREGLMNNDGTVEWTRTYS